VVGFEVGRPTPPPGSTKVGPLVDARLHREDRGDVRSVDERYVVILYYHWLTYAGIPYLGPRHLSKEGVEEPMPRTARTREIRAHVLGQSRRRPAAAAVLGGGASPSLADAVSQVLSVRGDELREALLTRWLVTAMEALRRATRATLGKAAAASTNVEAVLRVLEAPEMMEPSDPEKILAASRARGLEARQQRLDAEGGAWTVDQVASHLRVSRQSVDKRRKARKLLALTVGRRGYLYPSWQFARHGVLSGLETILRALAANDPWAQVIFMLSPSDRVGNQTPLDALRPGKVDGVKMAASASGEDCAA